jgi:hypothetical protein
MRFAIFVMLASCAHAAPTRARDYYVLESGATWVYDAKLLGRSEVHTVVMGPERDGYWLDDSGGKIAYDGIGLRDERRYLLKEPLTTGARWKSVAAVGSEETYEIVSAHLPCTVPAGKFADCVRVRSRMPAADGHTLENQMTFARDVGLVHVKTVLLAAGGASANATPQVELTLTAFRR